MSYGVHSHSTNGIINVEANGNPQISRQKFVNYRQLPPTNDHTYKVPSGTLKFTHNVSVAVTPVFHLAGVAFFI